jgi:integrase
MTTKSKAHALSLQEFGALLAAIPDEPIRTHVDCGEQPRIRIAAEKPALGKNVSCITLRPTFAGWLLDLGFDSDIVAALLRRAVTCGGAACRNGRQQRVSQG